MTTSTSKTLRKAGAVALSFALALSTVAVAPEASAAAKKQKTAATKVTPSKKTVSITAGKSSAAIKLTINKKATKKVTINVKSSKKTVAKVTKSKVTVKKGKKKSASFKIKGVKKGSAKVTVSFKNKKGKTVKSTIKVTVKAKSSTDNDGTSVEESLKLIDLDGLQSDGTAIATDRIQVAVSTKVGTIARINWYVDDKLIATSGYSGDGSTFVPANYNIAEGKLVARVVTTKDTTYESDAITISKDSLRATISDLTLEDNYEDNNVALQKNDTKLIVSVKVSKAYEGKIKLVSAGTDGKPSKTVLDTRTVDPAWAIIDAVSQNTTSSSTAKDNYTNYAAKAVSNHALFADDHTKATYGNDNSIAKQAKQASAILNSDGSVTFKYVVNKGIDRGTKVFAIYDQTDTQDDDETAANPNATSASVEVPFVKAPSKLVINPVSKSDKLTLTLGDDAGTALGYINNTDVNGGVTTLAGAAVTELKLYNDKDKTVSAKSTEIANVATGSTIKKGVVTTSYTPGTVAAADYKAWFLATAKLNKDVYGGATNPELTSEATNTNADIADKAVVEESKTEAKDAVVTFTNLNDAATVYFVRGTASKDTTTNTWSYKSAAEVAEALDPATATGGIEVEKGAKEVTIPEALKDGVYNYLAAVKNGAVLASAQKANEFAVVVVPKDATKFGKIISATANLTQKITKFALVPNVSYNGLSYNGTFTFSGTGSSYVVGATTGADTSWVSGGWKNAVSVKDQFGADIFEKDTAEKVSRVWTFKRVGGNDVVQSEIKVTLGNTLDTATAADYKGPDPCDGTLLAYTGNGTARGAGDGIKLMVENVSGGDLKEEKEGVTWTCTDEDTKQVFTLTKYTSTKAITASDKENEEDGSSAYLKLTLS